MGYFLGMKIISPHSLVNGPGHRTGKRPPLFSARKKKTSADRLDRLQCRYTIISLATKPYPLLIHHLWRTENQAPAAILAIPAYRFPVSATERAQSLPATFVRILGMWPVAIIPLTIPSAWKYMKSLGGSKHGCHHLNPLKGMMM